MPGVEETMHEFKAGTLHSGSKTGPKVTSKDQALAIALSEENRAKGKAEASHPTKKKLMREALKKAHKKWADHEDNPHNNIRM